jgi:hypothetical protein
MKYLVICLASALLTTLVFYVVVGFACLHMTTPAIKSDTTCDKVQRIDDKVWCMNLMRAENEAFVAPSLIPLSDPVTEDMISETYKKGEQ